MPQLDVTSFTSQILWLVAIYFTFYIILLKYVLPRIGKILKFRRNYKILKVQKKNELESRDLSQVITTKLAGLAQNNLLSFEKDSLSNTLYTNSEKQYTNCDPIVLDQHKKNITNLESLYIKKQLLEKYEHEKHN